MHHCNPTIKIQNVHTSDCHWRVIGRYKIDGNSCEASSYRAPIDIAEKRVVVLVFDFPVRYFQLMIPYRHIDSHTLRIHSYSQRRFIIGCRRHGWIFAHRKRSDGSPPHLRHSALTIYWNQDVQSLQFVSSSAFLFFSFGCHCFRYSFNSNFIVIPHFDFDDFVVD